MSESMRELEPEYGGLRDKVHQLWKADQESELEPAELFHYTSAEAFQNILQNKTLWASEALSMNDPTEGIHPGAFVRDRLAERKDCIPQKILDVFTDQSLTQILDSQIFVASFCDSGDVLGQWRAYARDGRGYAIGFSPRMLLEGISVVAGLARVEYDAQKLRALAHEIIDYAIGVVAHSNMGGEEAESYWGHVANFLIQSLMRFKHPAFREEREWRMICLPAPSLVKFRVVGTRLVPYIHLPIPLEAIRKIRLGPRYTSRDNRVDSFLRSIGLHKVSVENSVVPLS
jgi:hypothetical protein